MGSVMMLVTTPACMHCGKTSEMEVDSTAYHRWKTQGWMIQAAFPGMPAPMRERLKTGIHPACWDEMFPDDEDDDEYDPADQASYWREGWDEHDARL